MLKKTILIVLLFTVSISFSQEYKTGLGLRVGFTSGVNIKHFISSNSALEGTLGLRYSGFTLMADYEKHFGAFDVDGLNWYFGAGAFVGSWNGKYSSYLKEDISYTIIGVHGIGGIEYVFSEVPISIAVDLRPNFAFVGYSGLGIDGGLAIRYNFQ